MESDQGEPHSMNHRPIFLSLTTMHEAGLRILREATELRMASALDPATLAARGRRRRRPHHPHRRRRRRGPARSRQEAQGRGPARRRLRSDRRRRRDRPRHSGRLHARRQHPKRRRACLRTDDRPVAALSPDDGRLIAGNYHVRTSMTGREIAGKTLGIIGFGRIGRLVGEIAHRGFGMKVLYHDIVPAPPRSRQRSNARRIGLRRGSRDFRLCHAARPARLEHARHDQPRNAGADAAGRDPDQHLPRAGGR